MAETTATFETSWELLDQRLQEKRSDKKRAGGFLDLLMLLLPILLPLLQQCFNPTPQSVRQWFKSNTPYLALVIWIKNRKQGMTRQDAQELAQDTAEVAAEAHDDELAAFIASREAA